MHRLARNNRAEIFALLFGAAADALLTLSADPKWLGHNAQPGITAVLHTWTRDLRFHPHVHCIVTGGGLARDQSQWVEAPRDFLFPVHVIGALFRGKFMAGLGRLLAKGKLLDELPDRAARRRRQRLYKTSWVVYAKRTFGGPQQVFRYLGRYTHRVAISNARLVRAVAHMNAFWACQGRWQAEDMRAGSPAKRAKAGGSTCEPEARGTEFGPQGRRMHVRVGKRGGCQGTTGAAAAGSAYASAASGGSP